MVQPNMGKIPFGFIQTQISGAYTEIMIRGDPGVEVDVNLASGEKKI